MNSMIGFLVVGILLVILLIAVGVLAVIMLRRSRTTGADEPTPAQREAIARLRAEAQTEVDELRARAQSDVRQLRTDTQEELDALRAEASSLRGEADAYQRLTRDEADSYDQSIRTTAEEQRQLAQAALREAEEARLEGERLRSEAATFSQTQHDEIREIRLSQERREHRLTEREERLDRDGADVERRRAELEGLQAALVAREAALSEAEAEHRSALERIAGLSADQAREEVLATAQQESRRQAAIVARDIESEARRHAEVKAQAVIVEAIQRLAPEQTAESVVSTVDLPSDEMKGRIIGREGRNIRSFEQITGVNVLIDDTPETVLLSCFDPVRRESARLALTELIADGRIHPARIEQVYERSQRRIADRCQQAAEDALIEVGIHDMHPELVTLMGRLRYRTSYGQNVLKHLVECANIAGVMAAELKLDVAVCKRAAFLHDIGKALTHEVQGPHAVIGADLARKYGESEDIVHAIEAHHNDVEPHSVEAVLTQACDAISGGRPGARRESLESYVQRLERLEALAAAHEGVAKVFAMQAGREVRVMVEPDSVDDIGAQVLARDIAKQVEEELTYPGQIRVTVVRESRATEVAR
ncbi:ribonucrease Y [Raineyella antarctica]|uniref:Ribonuclease Y n=1 Tax=Raineyella antarctica TaxID=1577474 RepID=A0A1G6GQQ5_9ACTN|nr:ribonuclease Y [Raineyella antarctica]SDB84347.1 ribonucrease Y [Raineyella antarctica]